MRARWLVLLLPLLASACASDKKSKQGTMKDGMYYVEPGAPDPLACEKDDDCVADTVWQKGGCCPVNNPYAQSRAWRDWMYDRRKRGACADVECSTEMHMAQAPDCASDIHCVAHRCADSCR